MEITQFPFPFPPTLKNAAAHEGFSYGSLPSYTRSYTKHEMPKSSRDEDDRFYFSSIDHKAEDIRKMLNKEITPFFFRRAYTTPIGIEIDDCQLETTRAEFISRIMGDVYCMNLGAVFKDLASIRSVNPYSISRMLDQIFFKHITMTDYPRHVPRSRTSRISLEVTDMKNNAVLQLIKERCETEPGFIFNLINDAEYGFRNCFNKHQITRKQAEYRARGMTKQFTESVRRSENIVSPALYDFICSIDAAKIKTLNHKLTFEDLKALADCQHPLAELYVQEIVQEDRNQILKIK